MATRSPTPTPTPAPALADVADAAGIQKMLDRVSENGMVAPSAMMGLQTAANEAIARRRQANSLDALTFRDVVVDAHEALTGIWDDLGGGSTRTSLKDILAYENRLRGLGFFFVALALVGLMADYIMSASV
jgi:hypothetical protein